MPKQTFKAPGQDQVKTKKYIDILTIRRPTGCTTHLPLACHTELWQALNGAKKSESCKINGKASAPVTPKKLGQWKHIKKVAE